MPCICVCDLFRHPTLPQAYEAAVASSHMCRPGSWWQRDSGRGVGRRHRPSSFLAGCWTHLRCSCCRGGNRVSGCTAIFRVPCAMLRQRMPQQRRTCPPLLAPLQDAASPEGPSEYVVELLSDAGSPQAAQAVAGCATTAVVDGCQSAGPAPASIRLRCNNQNRPCSVRVAAYMSPCPGGPQPQQLAEPAGVQSAARPPPANLVGLPSPPPPIDSSSGGVSSTTWVIVGVSAGAALLLGEVRAEQQRWCAAASGFCSRGVLQLRTLFHKGHAA